MEEKKIPFFARFLESQETQAAAPEFLKVQTDLRAGKKPPGWGGPPLVTMKYPSDDDEDIYEIS